MTALEMDSLAPDVIAAQSGDVEAYGRLVRATQMMAFAVAKGVLREPGLAQDAVQQAYLRAFRRLGDLQEPAAFAGWLRRIVVTVALNVRRSRRSTFLRLEDMPDVPILDEQETRWSDLQRLRLAQALLTLTPEERQVCDRRYHGDWSVGRLASHAGIDEAAMRKRLQRIRDKLRKEIEMAEQRGIRSDDLAKDLPAKVVELLARPQLTDLPENPVGRVRELLRDVYAEFADVTVPEVIDLAEAQKSIASDAMYIDPIELHRVDAARILRYDLTLPLLLTVRYVGEPLRIWVSGKAYRMCQTDAMHLEAFHQAEVLWLDERSRLDPWQITGRVLQSVERVLPRRTVKIVPTQYAMCSQAWELEVEEDDGQFSEVLAWGVFTDRIVSHLGGDPAQHTAVGVGYGLERLAMQRYKIDDIRKIDVASVA
jgi:RNA polymerase sigma-70 factor, ECF subfamily